MTDICSLGKQLDEDMVYPERASEKRFKLRCRYLWDACWRRSQCTIKSEVKRQFWVRYRDSWIISVQMKIEAVK